MSFRYLSGRSSDGRAGGLGPSGRGFETSRPDQQITDSLEIIGMLNKTAATWPGGNG